MAEGFWSNINYEDEAMTYSRRINVYVRSLKMHNCSVFLIVKRRQKLINITLHGRSCEHDLFCMKDKPNLSKVKSWNLKFNPITR